MTADLKSGVIHSINKRKAANRMGQEYIKVYSSYFTEIFNHSHNLFLEIAFNYGNYFFINIYIYSFNILFIFENIFFKKIKVRVTSTLIFQKELADIFFCFISYQMFDVQYYDGKISIIFGYFLLD